MHHPLRSVASLSCLGWVMMFGLHGCSSRLGPVRATQNGDSIDRANLPDISVEQSKECVAEYASQMAPGRVVVHSAIQVNEDGDKVGIRMEGIPMTANDFGACLRNVLRELPIAEQPFRDGAQTLTFHRKHGADGPEALRQFIETIPGVPIVRSELVLDADGYTVELNVNVDVVTKLERLVDDDKRTLEMLGKLAMASIGYDEIMKRAEQLGWVKWKRVEHSQSMVDKRFIGEVTSRDAATATAIAEAVLTRVMTKAAPAALAASQADTPAPGPGDALAVGIFAAALIATGAIIAYELITYENVTVGAGPVPAPASAAQPKPSAPPVVKPRKYPNQTCEDDEMARLEKEMHEVFCDKGYAATCGGGGISEKKLPKIPCSAVKLSILQRRACLAARWKVQNECFGGKPDVKHKEEIDKVQKGIDYCEALKLLNCAKGHPMAEK